MEDGTDTHVRSVASDRNLSGPRHAIHPDARRPRRCHACRTRGELPRRHDFETDDVIHRRGWFWLLIVIILFVGFIIAENRLSSSFKSCLNNVIDISAETICTVRLIDAHNGFFAATAAMTIAAFTITLWLATSKQARLTEVVAKAAKESADTAKSALIDLERPYL